MAFGRASTTVHPRVRGGAHSPHSTSDRDHGPSPRARGSLQDVEAVRRRHRSIPACAGEPSAATWRAPPPTVHPRVRGGADVAQRSRLRWAGPSPRARGSHHRRGGGAVGQRSIPACAGEPGGARRGTARGWVHPRVRGGACARRWRPFHPLGPSPRARGSHIEPGQHLAEDRSIPACAGEPGGGRRRPPAEPVHPRVRGGATEKEAAKASLKGPSPRARGSHLALPHRRGRDGSIPACAGEPCSRRSQATSAGVHPRVRGGAAVRAALLGPVFGPSPRARGSPVGGAAGVQPGRSIPACAGEPGPAAARRSAHAVHPRVRGGARSR